VALALAALARKPCHVVAGEVQQSLIPSCFLVGVHVLALRVFNDLDFKGLLVGQLKDAGRHIGQLRDLRGTEAPGTGHNLEAVTLGSHRDGLDEAVDGEAMSEFDQFGRLEGSAWIGAGFVQHGKREVPISSFCNRCGVHALSLLTGVCASWMAGGSVPALPR
jgi:hypothetical protein